MNTGGNVNLTFGEWLEDVLDHLKMTQQQFGDLVGAAQPTVSDWINDRSKPRRRACLNIAAALRLDPNDVLIRAGYAPRQERKTGTPRRSYDDPDFQFMLEGGWYLDDETIARIRRLVERGDEHTTE